MKGVGDLETLKQQNFELGLELSTAEKRLDREKERTTTLTQERDKAKRKASRCVELRKKHKAEHEKAKYWQERVEEN